MGSDSCVEKQVICPFGASECMSTAVVIQIGNFRSNVNVRGCSNDCATGSLNFGNVKMSSSCCNTYMCNVDDAPDHSNMISNGKKCYYCDGYSCSQILHCSGSEDRCITATGTWDGQSKVVKGCASKAICDSATSVGHVKGISCCQGNLCNSNKHAIQSFMYKGDETVTQSFIQSVTQSFLNNNAKDVKYNDANRAKQSFKNKAANSDTYNGAQSVTQSFLFLCCPLLFFIPLH
ncbi:uncharacterized protein [Garra rufa]|uniref:uncharacterized protein n=1 Tax=Garra rufa TaxID=137080 RepID=UPI003CCE568D